MDVKLKEGGEERSIERVKLLWAFFFLSIDYLSLFVVELDK